MSVSGKKIQAKIGATVVNGLVSWKARENAIELDATTGADAGYDHPEAGVMSLTAELSGVMDITTGDYIPIRAGTTLTNLKLYRSSDDITEAFLLPTAVVLDSSQGGEAKGKFEISATVKSVGSYTVNDPA